MMLGWELVKYNNPRTQHELYYWENTAEGTRSEVDYIIARDLKVLPIECKAGVSGKMKSLYEFMRQKHLTEAVRCSLENFSELDYVDKKDDGAIRHVQLIPLFSISNLFRTTSGFREAGMLPCSFFMVKIHCTGKVGSICLWRVRNA